MHDKKSKNSIFLIQKTGFIEFLYILVYKINHPNSDGTALVSKPN